MYEKESEMFEQTKGHEAGKMVSIIKPVQGILSHSYDF